MSSNFPGLAFVCGGNMARSLIAGLVARGQDPAAIRVSEPDAALLAAVGPTAWIDDEKHMDAVTAVSGSGPAYLFLLAEAMAAAGVAQGLSKVVAQALVRQTLHGAELSAGNE